MNGEWINGENIYDVGSINVQPDNEIWSDHPGGAMVLWCDGGAAFLTEKSHCRAASHLHRAGNDFANDTRWHE